MLPLFTPLLAALSFDPTVRSSHLSLTSRRAAAPRLCDPSRKPLTWQEALESVFSPGTAQSDREVLLKDLITRGSEIADDVSSAVGSGDIGSLLPPESKSRKLLDDINTVQRQVTEDILPSVLDPQTIDPQALQDAAQEAGQRTPAVAAALLQDPARAFGLAQQEAQNALRSDPQGLDSPEYRVLRQGRGFELREYNPYGVAAVEMGQAPIADILTGSRSFAALTAFVLGGNARAETLDLTTPVRVDVESDGSACMSYALPSRYSAATAPAPSDASVTLRQLEVQTFAVADFVGFATEGEVMRQRDDLLSRMRLDGLSALGDGSRYTVLQYNPPYTLPWLRRNELAIPIAAPPR